MPRNNSMSISGVFCYESMAQKGLYSTVTKSLKFYFENPKKIKVFEIEVKLVPDNSMKPT